MSNYTLHLKVDTSNLPNETKSFINQDTYIPLSLNDSSDLFNDYFDKGSGEYVYNDCAYYLFLTDDEDNLTNIGDLFVNNERIKIAGRKSLFLFRECFGVVKIEIIIDGNVYITKNIRVLMKEGTINRSIENMINYIYDNCDNYLYEEHKNSKADVGVRPNTNISIDTKLSLLNEIYDVYIKGYKTLKHSPQTKLINENKVGDFNELQNINQSTIYHIVNHTEELQPVNYNTGILVNKQYYEPRKTLVQSVAYSSDIYENQIIVGFLKVIIKELEEIKLTVETQKNSSLSNYKRNGYIDSAYYIYTRNTKMLNSYILGLSEWKLKFQKLFAEYNKIFYVSDLPVISVPKYTNIFRRVMPYNIIFKKIIKWFNCGNYDLAKSNLLLSFLSISKIYEYFCLLKINCSLEKCGYKLVSEFPYKYVETRYYRNTVYNNTFKFSKDSIDITVYFQPVIYGTLVGRERPNEIGLFRNTTISIKEPNVLAMLDENEPQQGNEYTPDYVIKISKSNITNYYIIDAKHSSPNTIKRFQLPYLIFKYLFSVSALPNGNNISGMCILCGKTDSNATENLYNVAENLNVCISPNAQICSITGKDVDNDNDLIKFIKSIELKIDK